MKLCPFELLITSQMLYNFLTFISMLLKQFIVGNSISFDYRKAVSLIYSNR